MERAVAFWTMISVMLGFTMIGLFAVIVVSSRLYRIVLDVRALKAAVGLLQTDTAMVRDLLQIWTHTWGESPEQVRQALLRYLTDRQTEER
jgi:hypothetical protein